jgi:L-malate glycosyltransferase
MKVLLLAPIVSHSIKWANSLVDSGIDVLLVGYGNDFELSKGTKFNFDVIYLNNKELKSHSNIFIKLYSYIKVVKRIINIVKEYRPDILHSHYATSYGFLGAITGFHPFVLSFWGSDVYDFPTKSILHRLFLKFNINKADILLSTSISMANEIKKYTNRDVQVTPFGIDLNKFKPLKQNIFGEDSIVIGTIKDLQPIYGIDKLLRAFSLLVKNNKDLNVILAIVGGGPEAKKLKDLSEELDITDKVIFTGAIPFSEIVDYHNSIDIFVALSRSESFGVSVIEASACEKPVVVSNVGGLPEVVIDNITGIVVNEPVINEAYKAMELLCYDKDLRNKMGKQGKYNVIEKYNWINNVESMIGLYNSFFKNNI